MRVLPVGPDAVLVEVDTTEEAMALYDAARAAECDAREIVPAARTVLFDGVGAAFRVPDPADWARAPASWRPAGATVELLVRYDGPDLATTADLLGITADDLVERHTSTAFTVAFCGFSPGFAYCIGLGVSVPRLASPRPRVEPGSVGLAGEFTGIYPTASPGGWRLIGSTDAALWDVRANPPALLSPGTTVRFVAR